MRIAVVANTAWYLFNFRLNLMHALVRAGHTVVAVAPNDAHAARIRAQALEFEPLRLSGAGTHPLVEMRSVRDLAAIFRRQRIDLVLSYTPKGNLYSALACLPGRRSFVPNVSGLGRAFSVPSPATLVVRLLYRLTLRRAYRVFFQNQEDLDNFVAAGLVRRERAVRLPGSGVDLVRFAPRPGPVQRQPGAPVFLLVARMLWDKGVGDFVGAAGLVREQWPQARFQLLGFPGVDNPSAISQQQLSDWNAQGLVEYLGSTDDVRDHLAQADCVVLPSFYREGVPRSLLEAAAMGLPLVTTDTPGCRDTVVDGVTGFLCRPRDVPGLARKLLAIASMPAPARNVMGLQGRAHMEAHFNEQVVLQHYLQCVGELAGRPPT